MARKKNTDEIEEKQEQVWIGTGSTLLDLVVGGGAGMGWPAGKIINIVADSSGGKSFLACELIANAYHKYGKRLKWMYDDCESGFTFDTKKLYGFEIMPLDPRERFQSKTVQEMAGNIRLFLEKLKPDEFGIYVVDSLDGLSSEEIEDLADKRFKAHKQGKRLEVGSYRMESAKFLSQEFFRTLTDDIQNKQCLLVFISQIRHNVDPLSFKKWTRAGGKALDFYAYAVLWLTALKDIRKRDRAIGVVVQAKTTKLKAPRPFRETSFSLLFDYGLDDVGSNIDFLFDLRGKRGELLKGAETLEWNDKVLSRGELVNFIEDNNLQEELRQRVIKKWEEIEDSVKVDRPSKYGGNDERKSVRPTADRARVIEDFDTSEQEEADADSEPLGPEEED